MHVLVSGATKINEFDFGPCWQAQGRWWLLLLLLWCLASSLSSAVVG
jgi:hypothetical protein